MYTLTRYQQEAVETFNNCTHGLLVTLCPGSGKSVIAWKIVTAITDKKVIVIAPKYVLYQYLQYFPEMEIVIKNISTNSRIIGCTPERLWRNFQNISKHEYGLIVCDESHMMKNPRTKRTRAFSKLCKQKCKKLLLTATPRPENVGELYPQISSINNGCLGSLLEFEKKYSYKVMIGSFWKVYWKNEQEIIDRCAPYMFSRNVIMPRQTVKEISYQMSAKIKKIYQQALTECSCYIEEFGMELFLTSNLWIKLLQICSGHIIDPITQKPIWLSNEKIDVIKEIMLEHENEQVIIWSNFREELSQLHKNIPNSGLVMGGVKDGETIVNDFKAGRIRTLIASTGCLGAGISLEMCRIVIIASIDASGLKYEQMIKRTNRITQTRQEIIYMVSPINSKLQQLYKLIRKKGLSAKACLETLFARK